jgi:hypothetical protein
MSGWRCLDSATVSPVSAFFFVSLGRSLAGFGACTLTRHIISYHIIKVVVISGGARGLFFYNVILWFLVVQKALICNTTVY